MERNTKLPWTNGYGTGVTGPSTPTECPTVGEFVEYQDWIANGQNIESKPKIGHTVISKDRETIAIIPLCRGDGEEIAAFITKACNAHEDLLAACKEAQGYILDLEARGIVDNPDAFHTLRAVIAKVKVRKDMPT